MQSGRVPTERNRSMAAAGPNTIAFVLAGTDKAQELGAAARGAAPPSLQAGLSRRRIKHSVRVGAQRGALAMFA
jgi:hypothetical protein